MRHIRVAKAESIAAEPLDGRTVAGITGQTRSAFAVDSIQRLVKQRRGSGVYDPVLVAGDERVYFRRLVVGDAARVFGEPRLLFPREQAQRALDVVGVHQHRVLRRADRAARGHHDFSVETGQHVFFDVDDAARGRWQASHVDPNSAGWTGEVIQDFARAESLRQRRAHRHVGERPGVGAHEGSGLKLRLERNRRQQAAAAQNQRTDNPEAHRLRADQSHADLPHAA